MRNTATETTFYPKAIFYPIDTTPLHILNNHNNIPFSQATSSKEPEDFFYQKEEQTLENTIKELIIYWEFLLSISNPIEEESDEIKGLAKEICNYMQFLR